MKTDLRSPVKLADYQPFPFEIEQTELWFDLDENATIVRSKLKLVRKPDMDGPLILDGENLELLEIRLDNRKLNASEYELDEQNLTLSQLADKCVLEITTRFSPSQNLSLSGLYMSGGRFCTQCEAQGFRHITYYPDRPDVMSRFEVYIEADTSFATLLSNGNLLEQGNLPNHRHFARWQDPFKKPAYLFALVAGSFDLVEDEFTTMSNRTIPLRIYVDPGDAHLADYAMDALKRSMKWDEDVFGREYDLDLFMIVAVRSFNFGAMENKGLNIFNSSVLLADANTATDADFEAIESVVAHEYFHNWTGNRITCRDWFQLCLKEGLTVFRDQEFSADQRGRAICRIKDVKALRARQFPEDSGPLAHPVRPSSYLAIDNFYTATVYEKGAELIRALKTILGENDFAKGMEYYFETCDGTAATMEQFLDCLAKTSGRDLSKFLRWYAQAGRPIVRVDEHWDEDSKTLKLTFSQRTNPTPGETKKQNLPIPIRLGLQGLNGPLDFMVQNMHSSPVEETVIVLEDKQASWTFIGLDERPVVSVFRGFSAPVDVEIARTEQQQAHLIAHDPDWFTRWEEAQKLGRRQLQLMTSQIGQGSPPSVQPTYIEAMGAIIHNSRLDPAFVALAVQPPSEDEILQLTDNAIPKDIASARHELIRQVAKNNSDRLLELQEEIRPTGPFSPDATSAGKRALANQALIMMAHLQTSDSQEMAWRSWQDADNMTDTIAALHALDISGSQQFENALDEFCQRWRNTALVMDKWFQIQACATQTTTIGHIKDLLDHADFNLENPNRVRAVYMAFATANLPLFHQANGEGYDLLADGILQIDRQNPALAARLMGAFSSWRKVEAERRELAKKAIERVKSTSGLSKNTFEIASRHLMAIN